MCQRAVLSCSEHRTSPRAGQHRQGRTRPGGPPCPAGWSAPAGCGKGPRSPRRRSRSQPRSRSRRRWSSGLRTRSALAQILLERCTLVLTLRRHIHIHRKHKKVKEANVLNCASPISNISGPDWVWARRGWWRSGREHQGLPSLCSTCTQTCRRCLTLFRMESTQLLLREYRTFCKENAHSPHIAFSILNIVTSLTCLPLRTW